MFDEWSTQRAGRVRADAVLAMNVPNLGIHTLLRFPVHASTFPSLSQVQKESVCPCLGRLCVKTGLLKTLRLVLRCAIFLPSPLFFLLQVTKQERHA